MADGPILNPAQSANWWRCVFETSEEAEVVCARDGMLQDANRKAVRVLKLPPNGAAREVHLPSLFDPVMGRRLADLLQRRTERAENLVGVSIQHQGRPCMTADVRLTPLTGGVWHVAFRDTSQQFRLESHVQRLVTAIDATPDVFFVTDTDLRIVFVNPAFQTSTGYTIENALGVPADFLRAPGEAATIQQYLASIQAGRDWTGELLNVRSNGVVYVVEASISPIFSRQGEFLGYASCERDVTQRKRLESELRREHHFAVSILQSINSAVYALDRNLRLTHFNDGWRQLPAQHGWLAIGNAPELGRGLLEYAPDAVHREELRALFESVLRDGQAHEKQCDGPDGFHWLVKVAPWKCEGEVTGLIYQVIDQTKLCRLQQQLFQSQKMELVGTLSAGIAHDFNNLLQAIRGNASLMALESELTANLRERIQHIDQAAGRAAEITRQLLTFSRVSEVRAEVLDFNQLIGEASQLARRTFSAGVKFNLQPAPGPAKVRMDATRASQLLLNLCVNAQDAMAGGGAITISNALVTLTPEQFLKTSRSEVWQFVRCSVADTGKGIPPEVLPRIFEPFFSTKAKGAGTGLGLAIVHQVVSDAGGFIEIETAVGRGTTFHVFLPAAGEAVAAPAKPKGPRLQNGSGRVLVVEDSDLVREFTQTFLKVAGYEVVTAPTGREAIQHLEAAAVDLVLTDYDMPGMNGLDLIKQVSERWPRTKCVLASGYLELDQRKEVVDEYGCRVLNKPYNVREATSLIAELLDKAA
ncbi:MAG: PAS domain S-box protein [Verrucomicrobia bacterium]|nr:PAS domain S-box protein [Verrucomicrobiota bacterium]